MTVDERARHALRSRLEELLGPDATGTLMELLPHERGTDLATRQDVERSQQALIARSDAQFADLRADMADLRSDLRAEMADLRSDLRTELADLRTENAGLRTDLHSEMADLRTEMADLRTEMADLRSDLRTEMADGFGQVRSELAIAQRQVLFAMLGAMFTLTGLVWAIVSLPA